MLGLLFDLGPVTRLLGDRQAFAQRVARLLGPRPTPRPTPSERLKAMSRKRLGLVRFRDTGD